MSHSRPTTSSSLQKDGLHPKRVHHWDLDSAHPSDCAACSSTNTRGTQKALPPPKAPEPPEETPTSSNATQTMMPPGRSSAGRVAAAASPTAEGNLSIARRFRSAASPDDHPSPDTAAPASPSAPNGDYAVNIRHMSSHRAAAADGGGRPVTAPSLIGRTTSATATVMAATGGSSQSPTRMGRPQLSIGGFLPSDQSGSPSASASPPGRSPLRGSSHGGQQPVYANIHDEMNARAVSPNAERGLLWVVPRTTFAELQADWSVTRQGMALEMQKLANTQRVEASRMREVLAHTQEAVQGMHGDVNEQLARIQQEQQEQIEELRTYMGSQVDGLRQSLEALTVGLQALCTTLAHQSAQSGGGGGMSASYPTVTVSQLAKAALEQMAIQETNGKAPPPPATPSGRPMTPGDAATAGLALVADRVARDLRVQHNTILAPVNIAMLRPSGSSSTRNGSSGGSGSGRR